MCRLEKDTRNESSLRKFMNVNDMQVPDEDDRVAAQPPPHDQSEQQDRERANLRGKQSLANKIVRSNFGSIRSPARVWHNLWIQTLTLNCTWIVWFQCENKSNLHLEFYTRNVPDEMPTSWKLLVDVMSKSFRKRSRLHRTPLWSCNTRAMRSTHDPDDDSQQGPDFVDARPRADSSVSRQVQ